MRARNEAPGIGFYTNTSPRGEIMDPTEFHFNSPEWHWDVLRERQEAVKSGRETFIDWEVAKAQLRARLKMKKKRKKQ